MRRYILLMIIAILAVPNILAYTLEDDVVYENGSIGILTVHPYDVINPDKNWQYISITAKKGDDFKFLMDFYDDVEWMIIEEFKETYDPYNYCYQDKDCEIRYAKTMRWIDVTKEYLKSKNDGKDKYSLNTLRKIKDQDQILLRIKYKPKKSKGKWDLIFEDKFAYQDILDPWYSVSDANETPSFLLLTNKSQTYTSEYYPYLVQADMESTTGWTTVYGENLRVNDSRIEGEYSLFFDVNETDILGDLKYTPNFDISNYTNMVIWFYINNTSTLECGSWDDFEITLYSEVSAVRSSYALDCPPYVGWTKYDINLSDPDAEFGGGINNSIVEMRLIFDHAPSKLTAGWDYMYFYNISDHFLEDWTNDPNNNQTYDLLWTDNGFGYNTTVISAWQMEDEYDKLYINVTDYENFEIIWKEKQIDQAGSDYCGGEIRDPLNNNVARIVLYNQRVYAQYDDASHADYPDGLTVNENQWVYFRMIDNNSFVSLYYAYNISNPESNWSLAYNYTTTHDSDYFWFRTRRAQCAYDDFVIRELLYNETYTANLFPSLVMSDAENDPIVNITLEYFRNSALTYNVTIDDPIDSYYYPDYLFYPGGDWYINVTICDASGCDEQTTQNLSTIIGTYMKFYDELSREIITEKLSIVMRSDAVEIIDSTTSGEYLKADTELPPDLYQVLINGSNYYPRSYYVTVTNETLQTHNFYMLHTNDSSIVSFYVKDTSDTFLENISVIPMRLMNLSWNPVSHRFTDVSGAVQINLDPFARYYVVFTDGSGEFETKDTFIEPVFSSYTVYLDSTSPSNFTTVWDYLTYEIGTTNTTLDPIPHNFTFTVVSINGNIENFGINSTIGGIPYGTTVSGSPSGGMAFLYLPLNESNNENVNVSYFINTNNPHSLIFPLWYSIINISASIGNNSFVASAIELRSGITERQRLIIVEFIAIFSVAIFMIFIRREYTPLVGIPVLAFFALPQIAWIPVWIVAFQSLTMIGFFAVGIYD